MTIRVYDYSKSKIPLMNYLNREILNGIQTDYYLDTDWYGGPNLVIQLKDESKENNLSSQLKSILYQFKKENPTPLDTIQKKKHLYLSEQHRLADLELREYRTNELLEEEGSIIIIDGKTGIYNSHYHKTILDKNKYFLQKIHNKILNIIPDMNEEEKISFFVEQFKYIALLYNGKYEEGYISFLSHVVGFFSRAKYEKTDISYKDKFETMYESHYKGKAILTENSLCVLEEWKYHWMQVADNLKSNLTDIVTQEDRFISLDEQYDAFVSNVSKIDSPFHDLLLKKSNIKEFMMSQQMLNFRNIINLFYSTLPLFEQSMLKKHFYGFCVIKDIQDKYDNLLLEV